MFEIVSVLDAVIPKMFEELKSQVDSLAQEVALLKEQQALQTGECGRQCTRVGLGPGQPQ